MARTKLEQMFLDPDKSLVELAFTYNTHKEAFLDWLNSLGMTVFMMPKELWSDENIPMYAITLTDAEWKRVKGL